MKKYFFLVLLLLVTAPMMSFVKQQTSYGFWQGIYCCEEDGVKYEVYIYTSISNRYNKSEFRTMDGHFQNKLEDFYDKVTIHTNADLFEGYDTYGEALDRRNDLRDQHSNKKTFVDMSLCGAEMTRAMIMN